MYYRIESDKELYVTKRHREKGKKKKKTVHRSQFFYVTSSTNTCLIMVSPTHFRVNDSWIHEWIKLQHVGVVDTFPSGVKILRLVQCIRTTFINIVAKSFEFAGEEVRGNLPSHDNSRNDSLRLPLK